jgi:tetratricopeptide (TPR) repeat protein
MNVPVLGRRWAGAGYGCGLLLLALSTATFADQYRSEVRELPSVPAQTEQKSPEALLQSTTDPYAKTLILRDLAAQAARGKDYAKAARYLEQALAQKAVSGIAADQMRDQLSELYLASGDFQKLLPQLEAQVRAGKAKPEILVALGSAYLQKKRYKDAVPLLKRAVAAQQKVDPSWRRALAAALIGAGQEREALPQLELLLQEDPSQRDDWLRLAALQLKFGDKTRAAATMELAGRMGFLRTPEQWLQLVTLTAQLGAPFEAGSLLQTKIENGQVPTNGDNWKLLSSLWLAAREDALALPALDQAIRAAPSAVLYQQRAQLHMDREEYAEAARALEAAIERGARDANTLMALGMARYQQADVEGALQAFRDAQRQPQARKLAGEWVKYLESGKAREQALAAAVQRPQHGDEDIRLSARLSGDAVSVSAPSGDAAAVGAGARISGLTPIGAEAGASADGSIPPWTGGLKQADWPAGFTKGQRLKNPYPTDKPLFTITAANVSRYREYLSQGHQALLAKYPSYRMPVYPTRRSVAYPQAIYDASQANIGRAKLLGSDALSGARLGVPFPKPQTGVEVMWNHRTRYRGDTYSAQTTQAVVDAGRKPQYLKQTERVYFRYANLSNPVDLAKQNILLYYLTWFGKTRNEVDFVALVHESANSLDKARGIWVIPPKIPRMFRIPPVGYDQPFPGSEGLMFIDMIDMYNGAFDRYVWKLVGKRELYVPYNGYRMVDGSYSYADLLQPHHLNPEATRYERHRVWVIEATERGGKKHSFGQRTFYVDEDSWNIVLVENEDHGGQLWRFQEGHLLSLYDVPAANTAPTVTYDFKDSRYFVNRLSSEDDPPVYGQSMRDNDFLPAVVKGKYAH